MKIKNLIVNLIPPLITREIRKGKFYNTYIRKPFVEINVNVDHERKIVFIHNPKAAGTSIKKAIGLADPKFGADHSTPTYLVHKKTWEEYFTFIVVRHPIERLISSYRYHTDSNYKGSYLKKYPKIHQFTLKEYFNLMKKEQTTIRPQIDYINHRFSDQQIDQIIYFEKLEEGIQKIFKKLNIETYLPCINKTMNKKTVQIDIELKKEILEFYKEDFTFFKYPIKF